MRAAFGDHDVERQQRLEPTPQRIAFHQPDRDDRLIEAQHVAVQDMDTCTAVADECLPIAVADVRREEIEVTAQGKYAGKTRSEDDIPDRHGSRRPCGCYVVLPLSELGEQTRVEARPAALAHVGPEGFEFGVEMRFQIDELERAPAGHRAQRMN